MTDRPIPFSAEMVRAILAGRKTQTRRIVKPQPAPFVQSTPDRHPTTRTDPYIDAYCGERKTAENPRGMSRDWYWWTADNRLGRHVARCPYGQPGDLLWVREAWRAPSQYDDRPPSRLPPGVDVQYIADASAARASRYRHARFMPRWASRITLRITDVRVERLQDISEADARAEGCEARPFPGPWWQGYRDLGDGDLLHQQAVGETPPEWMIEPKKMPPTPWLDLSARDGFRSIWMSIHGPDAWNDNPWVWAISFERVKP